MCTYLNGRLIAFTGTLPPVVTSDHELVWPMVASGEREPIRQMDAQEGQRSIRNRTFRTCDRKAVYVSHDSHGIHGRKPRYKEHAAH